MKSIFLFIIYCSLAIISANAQQQQDKSTETFFYEVSGFLRVNHYKIKENIPETNYTKVAREPLLFTVESTETNPDNKNEYVVIKFLPITVDNIGQTSITGNETYINKDDNDEYFWITKADLDKFVASGQLLKRYKYTPHIDFGASISLPFKYRPSTSNQNAKITPDLSLGGYLGMKFRFSHYEPYYITVPVVTLGLTTISINDNTVKPTTLPTGSTSTTDGLVLGVTGSTGAIIQLDDFQVGFIVGWDRATGEVGKNWIYNNKAWYSVSIGYSFFGKPTAKKQ